MRRFASIFLVAGAVAPLVASAQTLPATRAFEPVVVTGEALAPLAGATPERVAAFRYDAEAEAWEPVPVQVDERERIDLIWAYNGRDGARCAQGYWCLTLSAPVYARVYTDEGTLVGPDADPFVDADDEVAFMAQDGGAKAPDDAALPPGVTGADAVEVKVKDPRSGAVAFVYLFWHDGRYPADAGRPYVDYRFRLLSGDYFTTYDAHGYYPDEFPPVGYALGSNPEDTEVVTPFYRRHFSDRWIEDAIAVTADGASGEDLLDRHKLQAVPGDCLRSEFTGSAGRGTFVTNKRGPVRAIRTVMGFNSGPLYEQEIVFYERYAVTTSRVRVHTIEAGFNVLDYSEAALGMWRYSNLDPEGVIVDGVPDEVTEGTLEWEVLQGAPGTLVTAYDITTTIPSLPAEAYYEDRDPSALVQCTGDEASYGTGGVWVQGEIPNTDPLRGPAERLESYRHQLYGGPALPLEEAAAFVEAVDLPLEVTPRPYALGRGGSAEPDPLRLDPPRPNPTSGVSRVSYWLEEAGSVTLTLHDALGREVAVLDAGPRRAGFHDVGIEAEGLASGTYFLRLATPQGTRTATLVRP